MKKLVPLLALLCAIGFAAKSLRPPKNETAFDIVGFSKLPVLVNGRVKPLDTVARSSLLQLQARQRVSSPTLSQPLVSSPTEWLLEVMFRPEKADTFPTFAIDNPDLLTLVGKTEETLKIQYDSTVRKVLSIVGFIPSHHRRFSLQELTPHIAAIQAQARLAEPVEAAVRTPFQRAVTQLYHNLVHYQRLRHALVAPGRDDFLGDLLKFQENVAAGKAAVIARQAGQPHDEAAVNAVTEIGERFVIMAQSTNFLVIPPDPGVTDPTAWKPAGAALLETFRTGQVNPSALAYAGFAHAWRNNKPEQFNKLIELFRADLARRFGPQLEKAAGEVRFNAAQPFYTSMTLYGFAFFIAIFSWLAWPQALGRAAFWFVAVAWIVATAGIATRMWLEGRPPVTNLYSSALFVGWGAVALCLVLEHFFRNGIGSAAAGVIGFSTLIIAHHLSLSGDTLEMMRAVLDSNFWLATHVIVVTAGYSATFLAGFLALIYIVRGVFTTTLDKLTADALTRMVYGIVCFATLFSFVGTILGGIWADQSWGRFWGWDPKENGALIIVIWNAVILHARWGGMIKQRGLMCLAVGGNIATAWSWFGTNMLGVGLHSYGFTDAAFVALTGFAISQVVLIAIANIPLHKWRSFRQRVTIPAAPVHQEEIASAASR
jgi:ABC-type transport system involved in cytochrome c biogenesis permease subunit